MSIFSPVMMRVLRFSEEVDGPTAAAFVDLFITGAQHGAGVIAT